MNGFDNFEIDIQCEEAFSKQLRNQCGPLWDEEAFTIELPDIEEYFYEEVMPENLLNTFGDPGERDC